MNTDERRAMVASQAKDLIEEVLYKRQKYLMGQIPTAPSPTGRAVLQIRLDEVNNLISVIEGKDKEGNVGLK